MCAYQWKAFVEFKRDYHSLDVLLISAVDDLSGIPRSQAELLYTIQSLLEAGKQIVLSGNGYLDRMEWVEAKLLSRIASGLAVGIDPPDLALREEIVLRMAATKDEYGWWPIRGFSISRSAQRWRGKHCKPLRAMNEVETCRCKAA